MRRKTFFAPIVCGLIAIAVQPKSAAAATPTLAGSWQFTLTPTAPPTPPVIQIPGLVTFTTDGSAIETDGLELINHRSPGHGIWQTGPTPGSLYVEYISLVLTAEGSLDARNVTAMLLALNTKRNQFAGTYTTVQEAGGVTITLSSGTVGGQLIPHVPLP
jgi:hypothetical protein